MADSVPSEPLRDPRVGMSWLAYVRGHPIAATLALLSFGAAGIHFAVSPEHFAEWIPYGFAFACLAWFQLLWAAAYLARPARSWGLAAIAVNGAVVIVWLWSRTIGLPIGPQPGSTEPVGFADSLSSLLEALLVVGLVLEERWPAARRASVTPRWGAIVVLATVVVFAATIAALFALAPQPGSMG